MDAKCALESDRKSLILFYPKVSILFYLFTSNREITIPAGSKKIEFLSIWIILNLQDWNGKKQCIRLYPVFIPLILFYLSFNLQSLLSFWIPIFLIYSFLSFTFLYLSFSIFHLSTLILLYLPSIHANPFLSLLQSIMTLIFFNPSLFIQVYPRLSMSIVFNPSSI